MCQFLETIQLCDGKFKRLEYHQARLESAFLDFYPQATVPLLTNELAKINFPQSGLFKCRVIYDSEIRLIEFCAYNPPVIASLKIVSTNLPSLPYKMADRSVLQALFSQRGDCDDVLLMKGGLITDTSYCNVAFWDGKCWFTPAVPLIRGVNRAQLLADGILKEQDISLDELFRFQRITLFNAMNEFGTIQFETSCIYF